MPELSALHFLRPAWLWVMPVALLLWWLHLRQHRLGHQLLHRSLHQAEHRFDRALHNQMPVPRLQLLLRVSSKTCNQAIQPLPLLSQGS